MSSNTRPATSNSKNTPNRARSSSVVTNWKKQKYKRYRPHFLQQTSNRSVPLPSVECFQLDYILNNVLSQESDQVINDLLNVTINFQQDLRKEIKTKLSTEQKIQLKNITICKEANSINQIIHQRRKKLKKVLTSSSFGIVNDTGEYDEGEVNHLLKKSIEVSDRVKSSISKIRDMEERHRPGRESLVSIKREKYPNLYNLLSKQRKEVENDGNVENDGVIDKHSEVTKNPENGAKTLDAYVSVQESQSEQKHGGTQVEESPFLVKKEDDIRKRPNPSTDTPASPKDEIMDPSEFELFMSNSIVKYREQQNKSIKTIHTKGASINSSPTNYKSGGNPLNLLYSQLISNPKYLDQHHCEQSASNYPFSSILSMKSAATIKSTQQSSHFKKLRINGSPLTSEHFRREREKLQRSGESEEDKTAQMLNGLTLDQNDDVEATDESEDVWNSSGMNTEDDEESEYGEDGKSSRFTTEGDATNSNDTSSLSSSELDSSDSDSFGDLMNLQLASNRFYANLRKDVKQRRRNQKTKKPANQKKYRIQVKEMSPTPKHQPSHHILKPKSSILKTKPTSPIKQRSCLQGPNSAVTNDYDHEVSALSEVNNAYGSKTDNYTSSYNACGTIVLNHDSNRAHGDHSSIGDGGVVSDGEGSPRSISILKSFMQ
ncbi:hypothetical protein KGF57_005337 [Candida theae]|uniref:Uncharacterized protein n=1 Tax=Candida theae TaxID=1198502 RepID=A0AAD5BA31_9ASCO|nr:uncharacterized protein KGF57_005337 [Candida theae]KAI5948726.1 hypothetical protein KGF57_005337 [Candida theae]